MPAPTTSWERAHLREMKIEDSRANLCGMLCSVTGRLDHDGGAVGPRAQTVIERGQAEQRVNQRIRQRQAQANDRRLANGAGRIAAGGHQNVAQVMQQAEQANRGEEQSDDQVIWARETRAKTADSQYHSQQACHQQPDRLAIERTVNPPDDQTRHHAKKDEPQPVMGASR